MTASSTATLTFPAGFTIPGALDCGDVDAATGTQFAFNYPGCLATATAWGFSAAGSTATLTAPTAGGVTSTDWGTNGMVTYNSGGSGDAAQGVAMDSSGNIYVAGQIGTNNADWAVRKYNANGSLDTTWGISGMVTYDSGIPSDAAFAIAVDADRNIYVAGQIGANSGDWAVRKYDANGATSTGWGTNGMVTYDSGGGFDAAYAIAIDNSRNLYVAGTIATNIQDWAVRKYDVNGALVTGWGTGGMVTYDGGTGSSIDYAYAITIDGSRNIYVAGLAQQNFIDSDLTVRKYDANGALVTGWGINGMVTYDNGGGTEQAWAITVDGSNNTYVAGYRSSNGNDWVIRKYDTNGATSTGWGTNGMITFNSGSTNNDQVRAITVDADRNIYVAGQIGTNTNDWAVRKYDSTGATSTAWGINGMVTYDSGSGGDAAYAIAIDSAKNIYVAGSIATNGSDWAVRKYTDTYVKPGTPMTIKIGSNATSQQQGAHWITNPSTAGVYTIAVGGTFGGSGNIPVSINAGVTVQAVVAESLSLSVSSISALGCTADDGAAVNSVSTTGPLVAFGNLSANTFYQGCHDLQVSTNAGGGYSLAVQENHVMMTSNGSASIPDTTCDAGVCTSASSGAWVTPTKSGLGHTCVDQAGHDCVGVYGEGTKFRPFANLAAGGDVPTSDNFNRADGALGSNWSYADSALQISSNQVISTDQSMVAEHATWGTLLGADQSAGMKIATFNWAQSKAFWLWLRLSGNNFSPLSTGTGYGARFTDAQVIIYSYSAGSGTVVAGKSSLTFNDGDVVTFRAVGNHLSVLQNGSEVLAVNDGTYSSAGYTGFSILQFSNTIRLDDFQAGSPVGQEIMSSSTPAIATGRVKYRLSVPSSQAPGTYTNTIVYTILGTF